MCCPRKTHNNFYNSHGILQLLRKSNKSLSIIHILRDCVDLETRIRFFLEKIWYSLLIGCLRNIEVNPDDWKLMGKIHWRYIKSNYFWPIVSLASPKKRVFASTFRIQILISNKLLLMIKQKQIKVRKMKKKILSNFENESQNEAMENLREKKTRITVLFNQLSLLHIKHLKQLMRIY